MMVDFQLLNPNIISRPISISCMESKGLLGSVQTRHRNVVTLIGSKSIMDNNLQKLGNF